MRRMRFPSSVRCSMTTREAASASRFRSLRQPGRQLSTWNEALIACSKRQSERHEAGLDRNSSGALLQGPGTTVIAIESLDKLHALLDDNARSGFGEQVSVAEAARKAIINLERSPDSVQ